MPQPQPPRRYRVMRNCCTSGACITCRGVTPRPLRVVQQAGLTQQRAKVVADGWRSYGATVEEEAR